MSQDSHPPNRDKGPCIIYLLKMFPRFSETFILNEILGLEESGFTVRIYSLKKPSDGRFHEELGQLKAKVRYVPEYVLQSHRQYISVLWHMLRRRPGAVLATLFEALRAFNIYALKRWIQAVWLSRELQEDTHIGIHCHFAMSAPRVAYFLKKLNGNAYTFTAHAKDIYLKNTNAKLLRKKIEASRGVVTVCDYNLNYINEKLAPGLESKVHRIYNGVNLEAFIPPPFEERSTTRILSVSRLVEKKGIYILLHACAQLKEKGLKFQCRIVGDGEAAKPLRKLASELDLDSEVYFTGSLSQAHVQEELRQCALLAAPCLEGLDGNLDALPTSLLEACATGTPVVSTTVSGIPEIITSGEQGILVKPCSAQELADAMELLLEDSELRRSMGERGRERAEERFDRRQAIRLLSDFLVRSHGYGLDRKIHVGYVLTVFPRLSETFILREIRELERRGITVTVFSQKRPMESKIHAEVADLKAQVIYLSPWWRSGPVILRAHLQLAISKNAGYRDSVAFIRSRQSVPNIKKFLRAGLIALRAKQRGIRLLHCHFLSGNTRLGRLAAQMGNLPYGITAHAKDIYASGLSDREMTRRLEEAAYVVTISDVNKKFLAAKAPRAKIAMIPNAVDLQEFPMLHAGSAGTGMQHILAVGRLVPKKGFHILVKALRELESRGMNFEARIAGEGEERDHLHQLIATSGLADHVSLPGPVTQQELRQQYEWATVLVVPSVAAESGDIDGVPVVLLEAMALGVPVIASRISGIPEVIHHHETGILVEPGDADQLCQAIAELGSMDVDTLKQKARAHIEKHHDIRNTGACIKALMEKAVGAALP